MSSQPPTGGAWNAVEKIAESDAGGWLMEFAARNLLRDREKAEAENQRLEQLTVVAETARALYERVEMDESVGICLSERTESLNLGAALSALNAGVGT